jgi:SagB-type dehydrogenase family enzyme
MKGRTILVKRSDCLVFFFEDGELRCRNFLTGTEVAASPLLVQILARLDRWRTFRRVEGEFPEYPSASVRRILLQLIAHTAIIVKGSSQSKRESALSVWQTWGVEARFFHLSTKNTHCLPIAIDEARYNRALVRRHPPPPSVKRYPTRSRIALSDPTRYLQGELPRVLLNRRTHRRFGKGMVSLEQLSILLRLTWGFTDKVDWPGLGRLPVKTSPSGGARHSLETYLWCSRVDGLTPGLYHYRADRHDLELLKAGRVEKRMARLCAHQDWVEGCSALFVVTTVLARVMWRYRFSRAYRVILLEAGHFGQTFCLVATWLRLAPFCTAALDDQRIESDIGLNAGETVLYAMGVGIPRTKPTSRLGPELTTHL